MTSITLAPPGGPALASAPAGQFLTVRLRPGPGAAPITRSYSLSGPPDAGTYRISVKRAPHGAASSYLHTAVARPPWTFT